VGVLTEEMQRFVLEHRLGFHATVCADGTPNLSPKGTTTVWDDDHLLFADIRSPQTVANLRVNPAIEVNVVDVIARKGWRFKGRAELHADGQTYERGLALLRERGYDATPERIRTIVLIRVEHAAPLVSPVYDTGASEDEVRTRTLARLGLTREQSPPAPR
jgi:predicted pyridoxine 5'-phosphate oxidase superfamily flavin-nucleotide-binding protein